MRYARKLMLFVIAAIAAMALTVAPASATDAVQVVNEDTGTPCGGIVPTGCTLHMGGAMVMHIDLGVFGEIHELSCNVEFRMKITGSGNLGVNGINKTPGDANCATVIVECNLPWPGSGEEDGPAGVLQGGINICIDPSETDINNCTGTLAMSFVEGANESWSTTFNHANVSLCEFDLDIAMEHAVAGNVEIHVNHP